MKLALYTFLLIFSITLSSCGEDRTGEYNLLIADKIYMEETLKTHYLWYDNMSIPTEKEYFNTPDIFFPKLLFKGNSEEAADKYSYIEEKEVTKRSYLSRSSTYGFDFELYSDPTGTTSRLFARVLFVLPNSPASEAGIERGDWLSSIGSNVLTSSNYSQLIAGESSKFAREELVLKEEAWSWESKDTVQITNSREVELNPLFLDTLYQVENKRIAYLVYNEFSTGPNNSPTDDTYITKMKQVFSKFKQQKPDAFILDLRYNPGGYVTVAIELATLLAPTAALGETFLQLKYNDKTLPQIAPWKLHESSAENLNLSKIYILTSKFTASASELIIHCLKPYLGEENVIVLGDVTEGKNLAMASYTKEDFNYTMWPVVAYTQDINGNSDYSNGIQPTFLLQENKHYAQLLPLGDKDEYLLKNTLTYITTGVAPNSSSTETKSSKVWYNSLERRSIPATLIHVEAE